MLCFYVNICQYLTGISFHGSINTNMQPFARRRGVGSRVVSTLVSHFQASQSLSARLFLLTLASRAKFYAKHGFQIVPQPQSKEAALPPFMHIEHLAGGLVARLSRGPGTELAVMELVRVKR